MRTNVAMRHGHLAADTQERIREKAQKVSRFHDRVSGIDITIDLEHADSPTVEFQVSVDGTNDFVAHTETQGGNLLGAVEATVQKIEQQLKKYKQKVIDQHRTGAHKHLPLPDQELEEQDSEE
jgi:ribosomal subunit interface protein